MRHMRSFSERGGNEARMNEINASYARRWAEKIFASSAIDSRPLCQVDSVGMLNLIWSDVAGMDLAVVLRQVRASAVILPSGELDCCDKKENAPGHSGAARATRWLFCSLMVLQEVLKCSLVCLVTRPTSGASESLAPTTTQTTVSVWPSSALSHSLGHLYIPPTQTRWPSRSACACSRKHSTVGTV